MKRLEEARLSKASVDFAGEYIEAKFKRGRESEKSLVLNTSAHGFYMGARHAEHVSTASRIKFWLRRKWNELELMEESIKASKEYIKKKGYKKLDLGTNALIRACLSNGFRKGLRWREQLSE